MPADWAFVTRELAISIDFSLWIGMLMLTLEQRPSPSTRKW
jgi:hypothetical protein